jgi:hypothetical protein
MTSPNTPLFLCKPVVALASYSVAVELECMEGRTSDPFQELRSSRGEIRSAR